MIWSLLQSAWNFIFGWAGIDMLVGFAAVAVAVLEPKFLDAITDIRKWAICTAIIAFTFMGIEAHGYRIGTQEIRRQWDAALAKEIRQGEQAGTDAADTVGPMSTDRSLFRSDPFNRDLGKPPKR